MRNTWKKVNVKQGNRTGLAKKPIKFKGSGIRILMGRAWNIQNVRGILEKGEKRHEFKSTHGFRKFFKSTCEHSGMKSLHVEMLMGHSIGLAKNYYRPNESEILEDYLKSVPFLTINDEYRLSKQVQELKEKNQDSEYVIKGKLQEKEEQIKKLEESVAFLSDKFNAFLASQPENKLLYEDKNNRIVNGIELEPEINNMATAEVIPSSSSSTTSKKKK